jgi:hypothetical protein
LYHRLKNSSPSGNDINLPFCGADRLFNIPIIRDDKNEKAFSLKAMNESLSGKSDILFFSTCGLYHRLKNSSPLGKSEYLFPFCEADRLFNIPIIRDDKNEKAFSLKAMNRHFTG